MQLYIGEFEGDKGFLKEEEVRHFQKVLRGKIGDEITITDGKGKIGRGKVTLLSKKNLEAEISEWIELKENRPYRLHLALAPTKSMDRIEFFLEKAVEVGIDEISFLKTFHSERKNIKMERCQRIVEAAVKQSLKATIPVLHEMTSFADFIKQDFPGEKLIAHCNENFERTAYSSLLEKDREYLVLIGPEGDFSEQEIQQAYDLGFKGITLGNQRLRTETAALSAVFGINWVLR